MESHEMVRNRIIEIKQELKRRSSAIRLIQNRVVREREINKLFFMLSNLATNIDVYNAIAKTSYDQSYDQIISECGLL